MVQSSGLGVASGHDQLTHPIEIDQDDDEEQHGLALTSFSEKEVETTDDDGEGDEDEDEDGDGDEVEDEGQEGAYSIGSSRSQCTIQPVYENGRRYCNDTYFMPNDEAEQTRLNIIHQAFLILLDGKLTKAPVPQGPCRILDVGTGPGDWAVEMGEMYPDAEIIATDISVFDAGPAVFGLPNVHFQLDDAQGEWTYHEPFDLVHIRNLSGAFRDWNAVYQQAFKHLKAGGYIEVVETELDSNVIVLPGLKPDSYYHILVAAMQNATDATGFSRGRAHVHPSALTSLGFIDVRTYDITVPIGTWPKDPIQSTLGKMILIAFLEGLEARSLRRLTATGKWTAEEVREICEQVKLEVAASEGATISVRFVTGRKPMSHAPHRQRHRKKLEELVNELEMKATPSLNGQ